MAQMATSYAAFWPAVIGGGRHFTVRLFDGECACQLILRLVGKPTLA